MQVAVIDTVRAVNSCDVTNSNATTTGGPTTMNGSPIAADCVIVSGCHANTATHHALRPCCDNASSNRIAVATAASAAVKRGRTVDGTWIVHGSNVGGP